MLTLLMRGQKCDLTLIEQSRYTGTDIPDLLACTELPLIAEIATDKQLVDMTDLVADALVAWSMDGVLN